MGKLKTKILRFCQRKQGVHSYKELEKNGAYISLVRGMVDSGELIEVSRGFYRIAEEERGQYDDFETISAIIPQAVFCLISALDFHNIGTQRALDFYIALPRGKRLPERYEYNMSFYHLTEHPYNSDIEDHGIFKVYSPAKTVADCFKFRNKLGLDIALEALKDVIRTKKATRAQILKQAEVCRVKKIVIPYMEALS